MDKQQKQIEEMANDVRSYYHGSEYNELEDDISFSEHLVNLGWIKPDENVVVLTREKYDEFLKQNFIIDMLKDCIKDAHKEMAKKVMEDCLKDTLTISTRDYGSIEVVPLDRISEICENIIKGDK